jgi:hypothetical protein
MSPALIEPFTFHIGAEICSRHSLLRLSFGLADVTRVDRPAAVGVAGINFGGCARESQITDKEIGRQKRGD